jgi:hypothetical protein
MKTKWHVKWRNRVSKGAQSGRFCPVKQADDMR